MLIIGLTGGIASGKSTVSAILADLGAEIIDADKIASAVVMQNQPAWHEIVAHFSSDVLLPNGMINRKALGEKIFSDKTERAYLENITHPYIEERVKQNIKEAKVLGKNVIVLDVPLLFESGWQTMVDEIWVVYVTAERQIARLVARNQLTIDQAMKRIDAQMSLTEKVKQADVIIDNNLDVEYTRRQILILWEDLRRRLEEHCV